MEETSTASPRNAGVALAVDAARDVAGKDDAPGYADWLRADVLIAPHHGSSEANTAAFVEAVDPDWIISSNGRVLSQKQRNFAELVGDRPLLRTHETGAVTVEIDSRGKLTVSTFLRSRRRTLGYAE